MNYERSFFSLTPPSYLNVPRSVTLCILKLNPPPVRFVNLAEYVFPTLLRETLLPTLLCSFYPQRWLVRFEIFLVSIIRFIRISTIT